SPPTPKGSKCGTNSKPAIMNDLSPQATERQLMKMRNRQSVQESTDEGDSSASDLVVGAGDLVAGASNLAPTATCLVTRGAGMSLPTFYSRKWGPCAPELVPSLLRRSASESALFSHDKGLQKSEYAT